MRAPAPGSANGEQLGLPLRPSPSTARRFPLSSPRKPLNPQRSGTASFAAHVQVQDTPSSPQKRDGGALPYQLPLSSSENGTRARSQFASWPLPAHALTSDLRMLVDCNDEKEVTDFQPKSECSSQRFEEGQRSHFAKSSFSYKPLASNESLRCHTCVNTSSSTSGSARVNPRRVSFAETPPMLGRADQIHQTQINSRHVEHPFSGTTSISFTERPISHRKTSIAAPPPTRGSSLSQPVYEIENTSLALHPFSSHRASSEGDPFADPSSPPKSRTFSILQRRGSDIGPSDTRRQSAAPGPSNSKPQDSRANARRASLNPFGSWSGFIGNPVATSATRTPSGTSSHSNAGASKAQLKSRRLSLNPFGGWSGFERRFSVEGTLTDSKTTQRSGSAPQTLPQLPPKTRAKSFAVIPRRVSTFDPVHRRIERSWSIAGLSASNGLENFNPDSEDFQEFQDLLIRETLARKMRRGSVTSLGYMVRNQKADPVLMPIGSKDQKLIDAFMELAKARTAEFTRPPAFSVMWRYGWYLFLLCVIYFLLVGYPLWDGLVMVLW